MLPVSKRTKQAKKGVPNYILDVVRQERAFLDRRENDSGRKRFIPQAGQYYEPQDFLEYLGPVIQILYRDIRERKVKIKVLAPSLDTVFSGDEELELNLFKDKIFTLLTPEEAALKLL